MLRDRKLLKQIFVVLSILMIISLLVFTVLPLLYGV